MSKAKEFTALKAKSDIAQIFLVFMATIGDVEKTALALQLDPEFVLWLAEQEGWQEKVRRVTVMSKSEKPGDWERAQNRCLNFVQAHRVRTLIDRLLLSLTNMTAEEFKSDFTNRDAKGNSHLSARFFSDIMAALDKVHHLSYQALGDTIGERVERKEKDGEGSVDAIHAALIQALNNPNPSLSNKTSELLVLEASEAISARQTERVPRPDERGGAVKEVCQDVAPDPVVPEADADKA